MVPNCPRLPVGLGPTIRNWEKASFGCPPPPSLLSLLTQGWVSPGGLARHPLLQRVQPKGPCRRLPPQPTLGPGSSFPVIGAQPLEVSLLQPSIGRTPGYPSPAALGRVSCRPHPAQGCTNHYLCSGVTLDISVNACYCNSLRLGPANSGRIRVTILPESNSALVSRPLSFTGNFRACAPSCAQQVVT